MIGRYFRITFGQTKNAFKPKKITVGTPGKKITLGTPEKEFE